MKTTLTIAAALSAALLLGAAAQAQARATREVLRHFQGRQERLPDRIVVLRRHVEEGPRGQRLDQRPKGTCEKIVGGSAQQLSDSHRPPRLAVRPRPSPAPNPGRPSQAGGRTNRGTRHDHRRPSTRCRTSHSLFARLDRLRSTAGRFPLSLIEFGMRLAVGATFFRSGMNKLQSFDTAITLFRDEYRLPLLPPELAAYMGTAVELERAGAAGARPVRPLRLPAALLGDDAHHPVPGLSRELARTSDVGLDPGLCAEPRAPARCRSTASSPSTSFGRSSPEEDPSMAPAAHRHRRRRLRRPGAAAGAGRRRCRRHRHRPAQLSSLPAAALPGGDRRPVAGRRSPRRSAPSCARRPTSRCCWAR